MEEEDDRTALRSALNHAVGMICEAEQGRGLEMPPETVSTLCYMVEKLATKLAADLPAFAKHARRNQIGVDDVLLAVRNNPDAARRRVPAPPDPARIRGAAQSCAKFVPPRAQLQHLTDFVDVHELRRKEKNAPARKKRKAQEVAEFDVSDDDDDDGGGEMP